MPENEPKAWITARLEEDGSLSLSVAASMPYLERQAVVTADVSDSEVAEPVKAALQAAIAAAAPGLKKQAEMAAMQSHVRAFEMKEVEV